MQPPTQLHLALTSEPDSVRKAAEALRALLSALGCGPEAMAEIELCAVEAMNNVIEHAYGSRPGQPFELKAWKDASGLVLELRDEGASLPAGALSRPSLPAVDPEARDTLPEGGWGLYILRELMDEVAYEALPSGNRMRLVRRRSLTSSR
ncbi:ATP-binding protein [Hyalangium gracile]|uniref:ATP-binding protein n=1 Tax=Hyalangium gracile TaxID=394092 RepID=UPI001CCC266B|nr:ATP-binding protein [Hyalangium gracile]